MQIQMQAFGKKSQSLRALIVKDLRQGKHPTLSVTEALSKDRKPVWAKIKASDCVGAINVEWDGTQRMLVARAIAERGNSPMPLLGEFLSYLLEKHGKKISGLNVQLRE
jgi:hypothetical protein